MPMPIACTFKHPPPAGFPMGLTLCVVAGADLFTSNCMYATIAVAEGEAGGPCRLRPQAGACRWLCALLRVLHGASLA